MSCAVCGGSATPDADTAYAHTEDCRIRVRIEKKRKRDELRALIDSGSLGTPGARAARRYGQMISGGATHDQAYARLTDDERAAFDEEMDEVEKTDLPADKLTESLMKEE